MMKVLFGGLLLVALFGSKWLGRVVLIGVIIVVVAIVCEVALTKTVCDVCGAALGKRKYQLKLEERDVDVCSHCHKRIRDKLSAQAVGNLMGDGKAKRNQAARPRKTDQEVS
jgi:hypothetical protein